jgi:alpha-amylase
MRDVILHAFNWPTREIVAQAEQIASCGFGAVLIPPPIYSDEHGAEWWQRYQPKDYRILRSWLGNKADIEQAIAVLHHHGVRVYADIVFNHMANEKGARSDPYTFPGEAQLARYQNERQAFERDRLYGSLDEGLFSPLDFNPQGDISNWSSTSEVQECWLAGLPDLDLNTRVVKQQRLCLHALNDMGFDGYRIDAIKHLPDAHIQEVFVDGDLDGRFIFGESLTCNDHEEHLFLWPLLRSTAIAYYDFALHETLRRAFAPGGSLRELVDPIAFGQALPWARAVTFSVTHDIPYNHGFRGQLLNAQDEHLANIYILGRDGGVPLVFSDHNESARIYADDRYRWAEAWKREDIVAMVAFHNALHGATQRPLFEDDGFLVFARGDRGIVAINKTDRPQNPTFWTWGLQQGRYRCLLHRYDMQLHGDLFTMFIPPRQGHLWLWQEE